MNPNDPAGGSTFRPDALASLVDQPVVHAHSSNKIRLSILATALVDALGGPVEFHKRGTFPFTTSFTPNTNFSRYGVLDPGTWTDDSSMTLCLARSIARYGFDEGRQLEAYWKWFADGELSAIGTCFDIGGTTFTALDLYDQEKGRGQPTPAILQHLRDALSAPRNGGNGSLMRVLPVGLAYWRDPENAKVYAKRSSETTHPAPLPTEACEVWTAIIATIMQNAVVPDGSGEAPTASAQHYSKLDLLEFISNYPYNNEDLRKHLAIPVSAPPPQFIHDADKYTQEVYYWHHHPILRLISKTASQQSNRQKLHYDKATPDSRGNEPRSKAEFPFAIPAAKDLPSSGFVLHSLVAALYCFFATDTFEAGGIMAVNLGDDADTVGAIYAGLAGVWYASVDGGKSDQQSGDPTGSLEGGGASQPGLEGGGAEREASQARNGLFWSEKVREWKAGLVRRDLVEEVAEELVQYEKTQLGSLDQHNSNCCLVG